MMTHEQQRYVDLATRLHQRTAERKIPWTTDGNRAVVAELAGYNVRVVQIDSHDDPETVDYHVFVEDASGNTLDSFADTDLNEFNTESFHAFRQLNETFRWAHRQALGADDALDAILGALSDGE